jgi:flagella basal body P-ring formation protein FlgA
MVRGGSRMRALAIGLLAVLACAPAAMAGSLIVLKPDVSSGASVTLGDLFDGVGSQSSVVIGNGAPYGQSAVLDADAVRRIAGQHGLDWDNPDAISRIVVARSGAHAAGAHMADTLTWTRSIQSGDVIRPDDLTYAKLAAFSVPPDAPRDANDVIGKVARRPLRVGSAVATHDVSDPLVIKADDTVQVAYEADGIRLVLQGKAMGSAAIGDAVSVMNPVSKKAIQAIASGVDEAVVGPAAERIRARPFMSAAQIAALR